jgi:hypothetical protein
MAAPPVRGPVAPILKTPPVEVESVEVVSVEVVLLESVEVLLESLEVLLLPQAVRPRTITAAITRLSNFFFIVLFLLFY